MSGETQHKPVLLNEVVAGLAIQPDGVYVDLTYGRGGHSSNILKMLGSSGRLIVMDKDIEAIEDASKKMGEDPRVTIFHADFSDMEQRLSSIEIACVHGILMDLGVSSPQLDEPERGFSFRKTGPLDMRMDANRGQTAAEWLATVDQSDLSKVIWELGEERYSRRIAGAIVRYRELQSIDSTGQLADIVRQAMPRKTPGKDAATRTFQAIRMHINRELESLKEGLEQAMNVLQKKGRLAVISFHSLEDRIVKRFFHERIKGVDLPAEIPFIGTGYCSQLRYISKAVRASDQELKENLRSRSAVLRVVEKL